MTDALKMEPDAEARAVRAILGMSAICKEEKFVPLVLEIERAFRDGAKAERESILKLLRRPEIEDRLCFRLCCEKDHCNAAEHAPDHSLSNDGYAQRMGCESEEPREQARIALSVVISAIEADPT